MTQFYPNSNRLNSICLCREKSSRIALFTSHNPPPVSSGTPVLCDLGEARLGTNYQEGDIMPDIYRAPEVILNMSWDYKVDIWSVGMLVG